jgi:uncharacterized protein
MLTFEFDSAKSTANAAKHGIDFTEAQKLWNGKTVTVILPFPDEPRSLVMGKIAGKTWAAVVTVRNNGLRIISVRRARDKEQEMYEEAS